MSTPRQNHPSQSIASRKAGMTRFLLQWIRKLLQPQRAETPVPPPEPFSLRDPDRDNFRQMTFTFAVIALAAKLAHVDGKVQKEEFTAFCELFPMPFEEHGKIQKLFTMASSEKTPPVSHYARQIINLFPNRPTLMQELVLRLCRVAQADGHVNESERLMLEEIAQSLGVAKTEVRKAVATAFTTGTKDPYALLGISPKSDNVAIKKAFRDRVRELHPDSMASAGRNAADIRAAKDELTAVTEAYRLISKKRKIK